MTFDRSEYTELANKKQLERQANGRLEMIAQAAVKADLLTGDSNWDTFLSYIQAAAEQTEAQRNAILEQISDPNIVDDNQTRRLRNAVIACNERIGAWKAVMDLPKDIIENGEKARAILDKLPKVEP